MSIFPVGLVSGAPVSTPIVENGEMRGFYVGWDGNRKFPVDMAGFAFSVRHFKEVKDDPVFIFCPVHQIEIKIVQCTCVCVGPARQPHIGVSKLRQLDRL